VTPERRARVWRWVAIVLLVAMCGTGMNSARDAWHPAMTTGQRVQTAAQFLYSAAGLLAALALAARWPGARILFRIFAVAVVIAAALAPTAWGGAGWWTGVLAAGVGALIAWAIWVPFVKGERTGPGSVGGSAPGSAEP
jgi:peptidoglycan/LPS O-acetylase OafA/YrhL